MTQARRSPTRPAIDDLESLVRTGNFKEVRGALRKIQFKRIPREEALAYSNLARRVDRGHISLRILNPIVRGERQRVQATVDEKVEYAASLRNLGAVPEATEILEAIDRDRHPSAGFQLALCRIHEWRYREALPLLREYLRGFKEPSYAMYVAQLNLAAALTYEMELREVPGLIASLLGNLANSPFSLLHWNCLELAARFEITTENWAGAIRRLEESRHFPGAETGSVYSLWAAKWLAVASAMRSRCVTPDLLQVRKRAIEQANWETVRDCDYYAARASGDREILFRLYFGTPFESYRRKILEALGAEDARSELPASFLWGGQRLAGSKNVLDLLEACCVHGKASLTPGHELHRLLIVLCQDFYKPTPLLSIFSKLFEGEQFNPQTSPHRVHLLIARFRRWIATNALPLRVERGSGSYRLSFSGPLSISIPRDPLPLETRELQFLRLRRALNREFFTIHDATAASGSSRPSVQRLLHWATAAGKLRIEGRTRRVRYRMIA